MILELVKNNLLGEEEGKGFKQLMETFESAESRQLQEQLE